MPEDVTEVPQSSFEQATMRKLDELYPVEKRHTIATVGDAEHVIEIMECGEDTTEDLVISVKQAVENLQRAFGDRLDYKFPGLKVYVADGVIDSGGQTFAEHNVIILDKSKNLMALGDAEKMLAGMGVIKPGDWTSVTSPDSLTAEVTLVHEVGHVLDNKAHGSNNTPQFDTKAPTLYGEQQPHEAYAEAFLYYVYGRPLDEQQHDIIAQDIRKS